MSIEIEVGKKYKLGSYQSYGTCDIVEVVRIEPESKGWYDDHQDGGWWSKGLVVFKFDDGSEGWDALEYAKDNWSINEEQMAKLDDGWVFIDENDEEIGFAKPEEYKNADHAVNDFGRTCSDHFGVMFRKNGELHPCADEDTPEDF